MRVAAIILNYNSFDDCQRCVASLLQQDVPVEIVIVDNASNDTERQKLQEFCKKKNLTLFLNPENRGYNAGNNVGLRHVAESGFDCALIANPDMEFPSQNYVSTLAEKMCSDQQFVVVASDILHHDGYHQNPYLPDGDWTENFNWLTRLGKSIVSNGALFFCDDWRASHECEKVSGCCFLVRISFLKKIGFFDEYPLLYCEEAILSKQVRNSGNKMFYLASLQAVHRHVSRHKGRANCRMKQFLRSRLYFIWRYAGYPWYGRLLATISWICYLGLLMLCNIIRRR